MIFLNSQCFTQNIQQHSFSQILHFFLRKLEWHIQSSTICKSTHKHPTIEPIHLLGNCARHIVFPLFQVILPLFFIFILFYNIFSQQLCTWEISPKFRKKPPSIHNFGPPKNHNTRTFFLWNLLPHNTSGFPNVQVQSLSLSQKYQPAKFHWNFT